MSSGIDVTVGSLGDDLYLIDAGMFDEPARLACYLFDTPERVLIECGPSRSLHYLLAALDAIGVDDLAVMAVTHIHLDHAGAAGHFARRFPNTRIAVHASGARHLSDPSRLWASASRVYGGEEACTSMWGTIEPVSADRLLVVDEGTSIPLGGGRSIDVLYTPGHARHHVVFSEQATGALLVGDSVGIAFPHGHVVQPVTPPPDFDPVLVTEQLHRMAALDPAFLGFAHFGPEYDVGARLAEAEERLWEWVRFVAGLDDAADAADQLRDRVLAGYRRDGFGEDVIEFYDRNTFWPMQAEGIRHWAAKRS